MREEQIVVLPYTFHSSSGEQSCLDPTSFDAHAFYARMRAGEKITTSQIPPQRYLDAFTPMLEAGEDILFVSMFSGVSGSYVSGQIAAHQLREEFPARKLLLRDTYGASLLRHSAHPPKQILTVDYEPMTGSHVGPGALALFFLSEPRAKAL